MVGRALGLSFAACLWMGCGAAGEETRPPEAQPHATDPSTSTTTTCPPEAEAPRPLPGVLAEHETLDYWLQRTAEVADPDEVLLTSQAIRDHVASLQSHREDGSRLQVDLMAPLDPTYLEGQLRDRLAFMKERIYDGRYLNNDGEALSPEKAAAFTSPENVPTLLGELRVALEPLALRCGPRSEGLYTESLDLAFDRNACSQIRAQEPVQVLAQWPSDMLWVRTRYAMGWVPADAPLSTPLSADEQNAFVNGTRMPWTFEPEGGLEAGTLVPYSAEPEPSYRYATHTGVRSRLLEEASLPLSTERDVTRASVLREAFALLGAPYGWGGREGGRDCSRFLLDVFGQFGLHLPRHSGGQAQAGTFSIDVSTVSEEREKLLIMDAAARRGIVLLYLPGHIMLYLGRTEDGTPMVIHSFAEYLTPCEGNTPDSPQETLQRVHRIGISNLELGRDTSRGAFVQRITRLVVIGSPPGLSLQGPAELRTAAPVALPPEEECRDSQDVAIFRSPRIPNRESPLRVIVTAERDPGPVALTLFSPSGERLTPETTRLGAPPWSYWTQISNPEAGQWTAVLGDGSRIEACERFRVRAHRPRGRGGISEYAWVPSWRWEQDTENFYSAFVEQLFRAPEDEDITWPNLQVLIEDPTRNLLHDHIVRGDDSSLRLHPDCADLPYQLRAYFAWKLRLPFGFRRCNRGREGRPPSCGDLETTTEPLEEPADEITRGRDFLRRVAQGVHSATARTVPSTDRADLYPLPLTRNALRPGTVYADPYGHLLVIARWQPQGVSNYGVLIGADAQPDATVGRRRFWRGSFLFTPDTTSVGAGFKGWRPLRYRGVSRPIQQRRNRELTDPDLTRPWSDEQYQGTADDFYDRMEGLINPRPLDASQRLATLVDALFESVQRRINSVNNGEEFMQARSWRPIEMPTGYAIFETSGPWEDFSTPSRDMRLLISMDAVTGFPDSVRRHPSRYGVDEASADAYADQLTESLEGMLATRTFEYIRSDGTSWTLTLADLVARKTAFEMAYNPNDCVEQRWAAPADSDERGPCSRAAPEFQTERMRSYRPWFTERQRPPR